MHYLFYSENLFLASVRINLSGSISSYYIQINVNWQSAKVLVFKIEFENFRIWSTEWEKVQQNDLNSTILLVITKKYLFLMLHWKYYK